MRGGVGRDGVMAESRGFGGMAVVINADVEGRGAFADIKCRAKIALQSVNDVF